MENQHRKIAGYRELSADEINAMNRIKKLEEEIGVLHQEISKLPGADQRSLNLAKTELQNGFMWFVRAVAKPKDAFVPESN